MEMPSTEREKKKEQAPPVIAPVLREVSQTPGTQNDDGVVDYELGKLAETYGSHTKIVTADGTAARLEDRTGGHNPIPARGAKKRSE